MTAWRKSEQGNIRDQTLKRNNVFEEGQQLFSASAKQIRPCDRTSATQPRDEFWIEQKDYVHHGQPGFLTISQNCVRVRKIL